MSLCTRCLTPVRADKADETGRCPRCTAEQAVIEAARGALDLLTAPKVRELLDAMCCCDPDVGFVCFGCAMATELAVALANLDALGGGRA